MEFDGVTVPLKSELTVTHILILETRDLILDSRNFQDRVSSLKGRVLSLNDRGLRIKFQILS